MGCTASTNIAAMDGPEQAPLTSRLRRKGQDVSETSRRQMKFLAVGNGSKAWIESISNGLGSQLLGTSSSHHGSAEEREQLMFRRDNVDYRVYRTGTTMTFPLCDDTFFSQNFDALVFCVSLAGYDEVLTMPNGDLTNEMEAALELFDFLCNSKEFRKHHAVLYFTDVDKLERKLQTSPIAKQEVFRDYQGGKDLQEALMFFGNMFKRCMESRNDRRVFMHLVKNPESSILSFVDTTETIVLANGLVRSGFLKVDDFDSDDDIILSGMDISNRTGTTATDTSQIPTFVSFKI